MYSDVDVVAGSGIHVELHTKYFGICHIALHSCMRRHSFLLVFEYFKGSLFRSSRLMTLGP